VNSESGLGSLLAGNGRSGMSAGVNAYSTQSRMRVPILWSRPSACILISVMSGGEGGVRGLGGEEPPETAAARIGCPTGKVTGDKDRYRCAVSV
jgi:hypothetical protein